MNFLRAKRERESSCYGLRSVKAHFGANQVQVKSLQKVSPCLKQEHSCLRQADTNSV